MDAAALRRHCARYVGVPFVDHGRDPLGWDCWGLYRFVGAEVGLGDNPSYAEAYDRADGAGTARVAAAIEAHLGKWQRLPSPVAGSAVLFRRFGQAFHVGFALNNREMLHVTRELTGGTAIEPFDTIIWSRLLDGAFLPRKEGREES